MLKIGLLPPFALHNFKTSSYKDLTPRGSQLVPGIGHQKVTFAIGVPLEKDRCDAIGPWLMAVPHAADLTDFAGGLRKKDQFDLVLANRGMNNHWYRHRRQKFEQRRELHMLASSASLLEAHVIRCLACLLMEAMRQSSYAEMERLFSLTTRWICCLV